MPLADLELVGGRVVDPHLSMDVTATVGIRAGRVDYISEQPRGAHVSVDVAGLVVAPGFIDIHSHSHDNQTLCLQALDGVTTALELEAGASPADQAYSDAASEGRLLNYGYAASWAVRRMQVIGGIEIEGRQSFHTFQKHIAVPAWKRAASPAELGRLLDALSADLEQGALGIGLLIGYAQDVPPEEIVAVGQLAASAGVPVYTHARDLIETRQDVRIDGATEIVRVAAETGAHMHYCHVNSTSRRHLTRVQELVDRHRRQGADVTLEAHPYGSGMTGIGAEFLAPERLGEWGIGPESLLYLPTSERVDTAARLLELRDQDPGGKVLIQFFDESRREDMDILAQALMHDDTVVASDAISLVNLDPTSAPIWPLPDAAATHPRTSGTFSRAIRLLHREREVPLIDVLAKMTSLPARVLGGALTNKGRLSPGADADVTVFDAQSITDHADPTASTRPSTGVRHVLVNGSFVVRNGELIPDGLPGNAVRR